MILDTRDGLEIDDDKARLDVDGIHAFLAGSYWSEGVPKAVVATSIARSDCFGVYRGQDQIAFARVVTDGAIFAYLCDVFVLPEFRKQGIGKWLMKVVVGQPCYAKLRRFLLATRDAHDLYRPLGFSALEDPSRMMEIRRSNSDIYPEISE